MEKPGVKEMLGIPQNTPIREQTKLHIQSTVERHVKKLQSATWLVVDSQFKASQAAFTSLREFFNSIPAEELGNSEKASAVDIQLINFSAVQRIPLITHDGGIYRFTTRLQAKGLAFRIYGLTQLVPFSN